MSQNLVIGKEMKIAVERLDWKEMFDKTEQNRKIGYDVMYCEDIEILKNDYKRYTMEYFVDIFFESGEVCFELNAEKYHLTSPSALVFQPDSEFRFISCDNPVIYILIVSKNVRGELLETHAKNVSLHSKMKIQPFSNLVLDKDIRDAKHYMFGAKEILNAIDNPYRLEAFTHFNIYRYYFFFYKIYGVNSVEDYGKCEKFLLLLEENYFKERTVDFYAEEMGLSKGYLNLLLRKKTGRTIRSHIDERIITESKRLLCKTDLSVEAIAVEMGFNSLTAFSKLFKRVTGVSPSKFRR